MPTNPVTVPDGKYELSAPRLVIKKDASVRIEYVVVNGTYAGYTLTYRIDGCAPVMVRPTESA